MAQASVRELIDRFRTNVSSGENWYLSLLDAAREWPVAGEKVKGVDYRYLIAGEALDLTQIAERLMEESKDLIPEKEQINLLFWGRPPVDLSPAEMKERLGEEKYKQHLNYFYGITVEESLQEVTAEEVRKEERGVRARSDSWISGEAFSRAYGETHAELLRRFRADKGYKNKGDIDFSGMKEFTYFLFKYRLSHSDPEKSASDTKKALIWLTKHAR